MKADKYRPSSKEELMMYQFGGESFAIPRNYIIHGGSLNPNSKHIIMETIIPTYEGYTERNKHEFKTLGNKNRILLSIYKAKRLGTAAQQADSIIDKDDKYAYANYVLTGKTDEFQIYQAAHQDGTLDLDKVYITQKASNGEIWRVFRCSTEERVPNPRCTTRFNLTDSIVIDYQISAVRLHDWRQIEGSLVGLVDKFKHK
jgi:hypothetical protein